MDKLAEVLVQLPRLVAVFVYPWFAKPMLLEYVGGTPSARFLCEKLVASFTNVPATLSLSTDVPEEAFALTVQELLQRNGFALTAQQLGPLLALIGEKGIADPDLAEPAGG